MLAVESCHYQAIWHTFVWQQWFCSCLWEHDANCLFPPACIRTRMDYFPFVMASSSLPRPVQLCQGNYVQLILLTFVYQDIDLPRSIETLNIPVSYPGLLFGGVHGFGFFGVVPNLPSSHRSIGFPGRAFTSIFHTDWFSQRWIFGTGFRSFVVNCFFHWKGYQPLATTYAWMDWWNTLVRGIQIGCSPFGHSASEKLLFLCPDYAVINKRGTLAGFSLGFPYQTHRPVNLEPQSGRKLPAGTAWRWGYELQVERRLWTCGLRWW